jgi:hypothetical protein
LERRLSSLRMLERADANANFARRGLEEAINLIKTRACAFEQRALFCVVANSVLRLSVQRGGTFGDLFLLLPRPRAISLARWVMFREFSSAENTARTHPRHAQAIPASCAVMTVDDDL